MTETTDLSEGPVDMGLKWAPWKLDFKIAVQPTTATIHDHELKVSSQPAVIPEGLYTKKRQRHGMHSQQMWRERGDLRSASKCEDAASVSANGGTNP